MNQKLRVNLFLIVLLFSFFISISTHYIYEKSTLHRLNKSTVQKIEFRDQLLNENMLDYIKNEKNPGKSAGLYLLESKFSFQQFPFSYKKDVFRTLEEKWKTQAAWQEYLAYSSAIWNDVKYFPVPESTTDKTITTSFSDGWMTERTYGGKRGHEGTDIMASENKRGLYPIVSMTDGTIVSKGWLEKGGYRLLVKAPSGACFYYAHMDSYADLEEGDPVKAGDILGFMGDTGYGKKEGTKGKFPVHLHVGIYLYPNGIEMSVNPYWILRYVENSRLKCAFS